LEARKKGKINKETLDQIGPGSYDVKLKPDNPTYKFSNEPKHKELKSDIPGPGTYDVKERKDIPNVKFSNDPRDKVKPSDVPGPGSYDVKLRNESPNFKFGSEQRGRQKESDSLGPGSYDVKLSSQNPTYRFGQESKHKDIVSDSPGPGTYGIKERNSSPTIVFGKEPKDKRQISDSPGPGAYDAKLKKESPTFKFGQESRDKLFKNDKQAVNIGYYDLPSTFSKTGPILLGRKAEKHDNSVPGPGSYDVKLKSSTITNSISKSPRFIVKKDDNPGPGAYDAKKRSSTPNTVFGKSYGQNFTKYYTPVKLSKSSLSSRAEQTPHSQVNKHSDYSTPQKPRSLSVGVKQRLAFTPNEKSAGEIPGPGMYLVKLASNSPCYTFGREAKHKDIESGVPGPGQYELKSTIPNVASYSQR